MENFPLKDCEQNIKDDCKCSVKFPDCHRGIRQASTPTGSPAPAAPSPGPSPAPVASPSPAPAQAPVAASPIPAPPAAASQCPKDLQNVVDETNVSISFSHLVLSQL